MQTCCDAPWGGLEADPRHRREVPQKGMDKSSGGNPQWTWPSCCLKWHEWPSDWHHADPSRGAVVG
eukprot:12906137-Prorocentrum_lima.AAC.1